MKTIVVLTSAIVLAAALAGCEDKAGAPDAAAPRTVASGTRGAAPAETGSKRGTANGTVTALDADKGTVTIDHGAIAALGWPAMEMSFSATPDQLAGVQVGDRVAFEVDWDGKAGTISRIAKIG